MKYIYKQRIVYYDSVSMAINEDGQNGWEFVSMVGAPGYSGHFSQVLILSRKEVK
jgi:hypothetical protein